MPSAVLLGQSLIAGLAIGALYGLVAMGLSLSWGLLRIVNISQFALAFLGAYLTYQFGTAYGIAAWWSALIIMPLFFAFGVGLHLLFTAFRVTELTSLLVTFGLSVLIESLIQWMWTADFRRYETSFSAASLRVGPFYIPNLDLIAFVTAALLSVATWAWLRRTSAGRALRASARDPQIAAAFGVNHRRLAYLLSGLCAAYAAVAGVFLALSSSLAPSEIGGWIGVAFAVVIIGRLGNPLGVFAAGLLIGVSESLTMAVVSPAWAPVVSFSILIALLLWKPQWA